MVWTGGTVGTAHSMMAEQGCVVGASVHVIVIDSTTLNSVAQATVALVDTENHRRQDAVPLWVPARHQPSWNLSHR
jgi:hypothetical protein